MIYRETQLRGGQRKLVRVSKKLARVGREYPTESSVRVLADDILGPLNRKALSIESSHPLTQFIEDVYFPAVEKELRHSTVHSYKHAIYYPHLKDRLNKPPLRLRDFKTVHAQRILREIAESREVGHVTLLHIKNFLSGVFKFARREGALDTPNPITDVQAPGRASRFQGAAYTLDDTEGMLENIRDETAQDVVVLLSLTGLRQSEARGLRWSDWNEGDESLMISRAVWNTHVSGTKNPASNDTIPVLPLLKDLLANRRDRISPQNHDYIFAGTKRGGPLDFHNLQNRVIRPALKDSGVKWAGFHGFRRGLGTNLLELGINPVTIARILRHQSISATLMFYTKSREKESRIAMNKLEDRIRNRPSGVTMGGRPLTGQNGSQDS